ncbi:MAG: D-hydantoinase [Clostridiales bacterium]|nr:D-hydantoinase [Clostridiales bacterium]
MVDKFIKGGTVVTANEKYIANIAIKNGVIHSISAEDNVPAQEVIDAEGKYIIPGVIDAHVLR